MEKKSKQELLYEINQLQEKLSEARETLHAIKKGEIDAFVVSDPDGEHIYTLESADYTYRVLVQSMNEGALILAQDGTIFYCNRRFAEMLKTSSEKLTGSSILEYVESVEHEDIRDLLLRAKNANCKTEHFFNAADGTQISVQLSVNSAPINDTLRFCVVVTDLTERKLTEETQRLIGELKISRAELETRVVERTAELSANEMKYRKLSQEFRTLLNAISDTLILLSPDMEIMWANRGNAYLLNEMISEAVGQTCYHLLCGRSAPCEKCPVIRCFDTSEKQGVVETRNGRVLDKRAFPIEEGGRVGSVLLLVSDITEKMAIQAEAMAAGHMASLGELAAGVAHEINNPITGIINYGQILINECSPVGMEKDIGARIVKEGERIGHIVKTLLSYAHDKRKEKRPSRVSAILEESMILTQSQIRKEGTDLKIDIPGNLPEVDVNFQQIQQCFINIINNARYALNEKYPGRHEDKRLEITGESLTISRSPSVRITFYDRGTGISAHDISMLTKPFFSTKPFGKGTGLGLSITHRIITDHGGRIRFESTQGEFTRVIIELPVSQ